MAKESGEGWKKKEMIQGKPENVKGEKEMREKNCKCCRQFTDTGTFLALQLYMQVFDNFIQPTQLAKRVIYFANVFSLFFIQPARQTCRPGYFTFRNFYLFLIADQLSQDPLNRFLQSLDQMIGICLNMTDLDLFFDSLKDVAMATRYS